jgi:hypothetical protein
VEQFAKLVPDPHRRRPFGNAARAIRAVNSGTPTGRRGRIDTTHPILRPIRTTREDDHTKIIQRDDQQAQRQPRRVTGKLGNRVGQERKHVPDYLLITNEGPIVVDVKPMRRLATSRRVHLRVDEGRPGSRRLGGM